MTKYVFPLALFMLLTLKVAAQDTLNLVPPANLQGESPALTDYAYLTWDAPVDSISGTTPLGLLGYNLYRDGEVVGSIDHPVTEYYDLDLNFGTYTYYVSAVYDLTFYGFPGETGESSLEGPVVVELCCPPELPFRENFSTGVFNTNQWIPEGNWQIAGQSGNPAPSAQFNFQPEATNYSQSLTSDWITGTGFLSGMIYLDVDIKLDVTNTGASEFLYVDVFNGTDWIQKEVYNNSQSFDWFKQHIDITDVAFGTRFKIRFRAEGENSQNIQSWFVDNINIYRYCPEPVNLTVNMPQPVIQECMLLIEWDDPSNPGAPVNDWITWSDSISDDAIQAGNHFFCAARFDESILYQFTNESLTRIKVFPYGYGGPIILHVWLGEQHNLVYSKTISDYTPGQWNEIILDSAIYCDTTNELMFGYEVNSWNFVAGVDAGPAIPNYGDLISLDGHLWESMYQFYGMNFNFSIMGYLEVVEDNTINPDLEIVGYNIFREGSLIGTSTHTSYTDSIADIYQQNCYNVTALYSDCESEFSNTACWVNNGDWDCSTATKNVNTGVIEIYPNPASSMVTIKGISPSELIISDILGNEVKKLKISNSDSPTVLDVRGFKNGVYIIKIINDKGESAARKLIIQR